MLPGRFFFWNTPARKCDHFIRIAMMKPTSVFNAGLAGLQAILPSLPVVEIAEVAGA